MSKKGPWQIARHCVNCRTYLTDHEYRYSSGVCPHCGNAKTSTFVATVDLVRRQVEVGRKWFGLVPVYEWEYKTD